MVIGRVLKPWGFRGLVKIQILTDFPERFASLQTVLLGDGAKRFSVESARLIQDAALLKLQGIDSSEEAAKLRGLDVLVPIEEAVPLPEGKYYHYQLIGLAVETASGQALGRITEILQTGANDVYVVNDGQREVLLPAIEPVIRSIDLEHGRMTVELLEGLI